MEASSSLNSSELKNSSPIVIKIGSRKSQLAMIQSNLIADKLKSLYPELVFEIVGISTIGDKILDVALSKIGEKSLFTKELEIGLLNGEIDLVVHSLKDLPTTLPDGLTIAAITEREDPRDALILSPKHTESGISNLAQLPSGSSIGTSSLRRIAQLSHSFPHLKFIDIRGNLNTRLSKLDAPDSVYDGIILAVAGINRMGWGNRISQCLESSTCMHAVGQGALGIECLSKNKKIVELLTPLNDPITWIRCLAERRFLRSLEGGCSVPIGVNSWYDKEEKKLYLQGSVWNLNGTKSIVQELGVNLAASGGEGDAPNVDTPECSTFIHLHNFENFPQHSATYAINLGKSLGSKMIELGANDILHEVRESKTKAMNLKD